MEQETGECLSETYYADLMAEYELFTKNARPPDALLVSTSLLLKYFLDMKKVPYVEVTNFGLNFPIFLMKLLIG